MKILPAAAIAFCILLPHNLSHAQEDPTAKPPEVSGLSVNPPGSGGNVESTAKGGVFSVTSKRDSIGGVQIGFTKTDNLTVTNSGNGTLAISSVTSSNPRFTVAPTSASLTAHTSKVFTVTFAPTSAGAQSSFIVFKNDGTTSPDTVTAYGTGTVPSFSVNRKTVPYGLVIIGTAKQDSVIVTNAGTAALVISSITSANARFTVSPGTGTIQPGARSTFRITFTPTVNGVQGGNIVFVHNAPNIRDTVAVSGTGTGFSINRRSVAFGNVQVGASSRDSVVVTNTGPTVLTISSVTSTNGAFAVSPASASIGTAGTTKFYFTFTPSGGAGQSGNVVFTHDAASSPDSVAVSGTGTTRGFALDRRSVQFGTVGLGGNKVDSVTVSDTGKAALSVSSVISNNGTFAVNPSSATVQPAQSRRFYITFTPANTNTQSGNIVFTHNAPDGFDTVTVSGTGGASAFSVTRRFVPFGTVPVGGNKLDSISVTNAGSVALVISNVLSSNGAFAVNPAGVTLQPAQTRTFYITFSPANTTPQSGNIVFTHTGPSSPDTVAVSGTGGTAGFSVTRRFVPFGTVILGGNKLDSVSVTNAGAVALVISSVLSSNGTFAVNPASATLQPAQARTFYITFTPANTNPQSGNIVFTHTGTTSPDTVTVTGTGGTAGFSVTRRSVSFGIVPLGTNKIDSVSVTNAGGVALVISSVLSSNGVFAVSPASVTLQPAQARTFYVTFTPANTNAQSGAIVFTHSGASSPDTVTVSGTGGTAGFSVTRRVVPFGTVLLGSKKMDSVSVTNAGGVALVISSVVSSNGTFAVNPTSVTLQPQQAWTFYITFTPVSTSPQSGNIVFRHTGASSPDTITVSGTGGAAGFAVSRRFVPFDNVVLGSNRQDSVSVTNTGAVALVISSVVSSNGTFTVNPTSVTLQGLQAWMFYITFTPTSTTPQSGNIVFRHSGTSSPDTLTVSGTGIVQNSAPALLAPANGATGLPLPLTLSWSSMSGASGYWLEMATDSAFTRIVISDPTVAAAGRQVSGLPQNTLYFWRVSARSATGSGPFSPAWTLTTVPSGTVSGTVSFSGDLSSTSYRMFGLPGAGTRTVGQILPGSQNVDWRLLRDTGKDTTYPAYYADLNAGSTLRPGEGYWLLLKRDLNISRTDTLPALGADGTYGIELHGGWNMISIPFNAVVQRTAVIAANGLPAGTLFWEHVGSTTTSSGTTLDPFKGYYFDNSSAGLATMKIPYPFSTTVAKPSKGPDVSWRTELVFDSEINTDRDNYVGIAPAVPPGRNELDQHEPPLFFDQGFLYFVRPQWDAVHSRFATDIRGAIGSGQTWDFEVWNPRGGAGKITLLGLEGIPLENRVVLVNLLNSSPADMRLRNVYEYRTASPRMQFKLIVGPKEYADAEASRLIPGAYELAQNYPNPFNPSTTISYMLPEGSQVRLEILTVLGQRVRVLDEGYRAAATYSVIWDGKGENGEAVSSGVYLCRLVAGHNNTRVRKLVLVK